jgi:hypothetical protein
MGMGAVAATAAVILLGRGITGRATGGDAEQQGCGGEPSGPASSEPVDKDESALTGAGVYYSACYWNKTYGQACSSNCDCASGMCAAEYDVGSQTTYHYCTYACTQDTGEGGCGAVNYQGDHLCSNTVDASGNALPPVCLDSWAWEVWGSRPHFCSASGRRKGCSDTPSVSNYCYVSGSTTWCQDYYTAKWCSSANTSWVYGYDYTGCNWSGWNANSYYCNAPYWVAGGGYQWDGHVTHRHCQ